MIASMTGFAAARGALGPHSWAWDLRSVNGKGRDLRIRVPDWIEGLEASLRARLDKAVARGSVTLSLRMSRDETQATLALNEGALGAVMDALSRAEAEARVRGLSLAPSSAADLVAMRGVLEPASADDDSAPLLRQLLGEADTLIEAFVASRRQEGEALRAILAGQLDRIEGLTTEARALAQARRGEMAETLRANLDRVLADAASADPQRVAQELALIAVKSDVTEEIDRLGAHVEAARALLAEAGPVGRKFDFLMQEFAREANTLCAKSQNAALTATGLELKVAIDQMREQVQNVE